MLTKEELVTLREKNQLLSDLHEEEWYDKQYVNNPYDREIKRIDTKLELLKYADKVTITDYQDGQVLLDGKIVLALRTLRWRIRGKQKWYYAKTVESVINRLPSGKRSNERR